MQESVNFDHAADFYDETRGFPEGVAERIGAFIAEQSKLTAESHLLEIGIGTGRISLPLAPHIQRVTGIDISRQMMLRLREKQITERIDLAQANAMQLPFADDSFDAVLVSHVFHLVPDPHAILRDVQRVLKPGATLLHGYSHTLGDAQHPLDAAWRENKPESTQPKFNSSTSGGYRWRKTDAVLRDAAWNIIREPEHAYAIHEPAQTYLDNVQNRVWSSMWDMSDDDLSDALDAIQAVIDDLYDGNAQTLVKRERVYRLQVCEPPA